MAHEFQIEESDTIEQEDFENYENDEGISSTIASTDIIIIAGKRGSGKSNATLVYIEFLLSQGCPIAIADPLLEFQEYRNRGCIVENLPYGDITAFDKWLDALKSQKFEGMVIIDEADGFFPNRKDLSPIRKSLIHIGRHWGMGIIAVTRRLSNLHTDLVSQANKLLIFRLFSGADLEYLKRANFDNDVINCVANLDKYWFLFIDDNEDNYVEHQPLQLLK